MENGDSDPKHLAHLHLWEPPKWTTGTYKLLCIMVISNACKDVEPLLFAHLGKTYFVFLQYGFIGKPPEWFVWVQVLGSW